MAESTDENFAGNSAIDAAIKEMLPCFSDVSQRRMKKAILNAKKAAEKHGDENTDANARHVFREFIPAFVLNQIGFRLEYETAIDGKTPDWLDSTSNLMLESYTFERDGTSPFPGRVKAAIAKKCDKYRDILANDSLRFVVSVHLDFLAFITLDDCDRESAEFRATFGENDALWGILFFTEHQPGISIGGQQYGFFWLTTDRSHETVQNGPFRSKCVWE